MMPVPERRKRGRGSCFGKLTCFGGAPYTAGDSVDRAGGAVGQRGRRTSWFISWSRFRKKKKTVPVDAPTGDLSPGKGAGGVEKAAGRKGADADQNQEEEGERTEKGKQHRQRSELKLGQTQTTIFEKLRENKGWRWLRLPTSRPHKEQDGKPKRRRRRQPASAPPPENARIPSLSRKYDAGRVSTPRAKLESARGAASRLGRHSSVPAAGTQLDPSLTVVSSSTQHSRISPPGTAAECRLGGGRSQKNAPALDPTPCLSAGGSSQLLGLSVMAVILLVIVLFGRVSAVILTCLWLYYLPRVRASMVVSEGGDGSDGAAAIDLDSGEYKKKVVLEGLLQRDARRTPGLPHSSAGSPARNNARAAA